MNNLINDEKVLNIINDGSEYISSVDEDILFFKNSIDIIKELCLKAQSFQPLIDSNVSLNFNTIWNIEKNNQILQIIDLLEVEVDNLRECLLEFVDLNSNVENVFEQIQQYRREIENAFNGVGSSSFATKNNEPNYNTVVSNKEEVANAINEHFVQNRNLNDQFSEKVYRQVYDEIMNFSSGDASL